MNERMNVNQVPYIFSVCVWGGRGGGDSKPIRASASLAGSLASCWQTSQARCRSPGVPALTGSLWELTHVIGKGALEPIKDKPALLPRFNLAAHLDQVAAADLVGSNTGELYRHGSPWASLPKQLLQYRSPALHRQRPPPTSQASTQDTGADGDHNSKARPPQRTMTTTKPPLPTA